MADMSDRELIGYCRIHCTTERALFSAKHINRMLELAGHPKGFAKHVDGWLSVHEPMAQLCGLADARLTAGVRAMCKSSGKSCVEVTWCHAHPEGECAAADGAPTYPIPLPGGGNIIGDAPSLPPQPYLPDGVIETSDEAQRKGNGHE